MAPGEMHSKTAALPPDGGDLAPAPRRSYTAFAHIQSEREATSDLTSEACADGRYVNQPVPPEPEGGGELGNPPKPTGTTRTGARCEAQLLSWGACYIVVWQQLQVTAARGDLRVTDTQHWSICTPAVRVLGGAHWSGQSPELIRQEDFKGPAWWIGALCVCCKPT